MLELYHCAPAPESLAIFIVLREKGIDFHSRPLNVLEFEHCRPAFLALSPRGRLPVLVHDGKVLNDPVLLPEYIEEAFPEPPLAARDAAGWYDVQDWIRYGDAELNDAVNTLGWYGAVLPAMGDAERKAFEQRRAAAPVIEQKAGWAAVVRDAESTEDRLDNARGKVRDAIARMEPALAGAGWLAGGACSIADISNFALARTLPRLLPEEVNSARTPNVVRWLERINARAAVANMAMLQPPAGGSGFYLPR